MSEFTKKIKNLSMKKRFMIIFAIMLILRIGYTIPVPFINAEYFSAMTESFHGNFFNTITGGSFKTMSLFALSIAPYITGSIIIQLLSVIFPSIEELRKDGESGQKKYKLLIAGSGLVLALIEALGIALAFGRRGLLSPFNAGTVIGAVALWTIGAGILILIGETIEKWGAGSGISMILLANILVGIPDDLLNVYNMYVQGRSIPIQMLVMVLFAGLLFGIIFLCTKCATAHKDIPITYSGRLRSASQKSKFPIPLFVCSVMPIIFASTIMGIASMVQMFVNAQNHPALNKFLNAFSTANWFNTAAPLYTLGVIPYIALTVLFTYFYIEIGFNPNEIAENLKKSGAMTPGLRPGAPTKEYLRKEIRKIALLGNAFMVAIILGTNVIGSLSHINSFAMAGTSCVIAISILNESYEKLQAEQTAVNASLLGIFKGRSKKYA